MPSTSARLTEEEGMPDLLRKPFGKHGKIHHVTAHSAGWRYVGFSLYRLRPGEVAEEATGDREVILVVVEGKAKFEAAGQDWGVLGDRLNVFEKSPPHCLYLPDGSDWRAVAETDCTIAVCSAPGSGGHPARRIGPDGIGLTERGKGTNTRYINNIAMENEDYCDSLLVTEVFTPAGHWSSYPSHRHDEDDFPRITYLEETYYHRLNPSLGFGIQRVYTDDGLLDETMAVKDHDVVLVPRGHHPCGAPYGFEMYYLNVMAGPMRKWRFVAAPEVEWLMERDR
jgi:5-deoxy-glucuronate isomerase